MEVVGSVKAVEDDATNDEVNDLIFELQLVSGGSGVDMDAVIYSYSDPSTYIAEITCTEAWLTGASTMLEADEIVEVTCVVDNAHLKKNTQFQLEVKPPTGAVIPIVRTTPAEIKDDETMVLNY